MQNFRIYLAFIIAAFCHPLFAQEYPVSIILPEASKDLVEETLIPNKKNKSNQDLLQPIIDDLINKNYLAASIDSIVSDTITKVYKAYLFTGRQYDFKAITFDSLSEDFMNRLKIKKPTSTQEFILMREVIGDYYAENGYPFSKLRIDDLSLDNGDIEGQLKINTGPQIIIDSIEINGDVKIREGYIENYLDIFKGELYDAKKVKRIKSKMDKLTFLEQEQDPDLNFFGNYSTVNLYLKKKNSSRFDLLFGVIPTDNIENRSLFLSLDFTAEMLNRLGFGEYIYIDFERLRPEQQRFQVKFNYPYILDTPFAIDANFNIFRLGLNYQTLITDLGVQYLLNSTDHIKLAWNFESSNLIEINEEAILASGMLPGELDVSQSGIALSLHVDKLDYRFNPREGYSIDMKIVGGERKVKRNSAILALSELSDSVDFSALYDEIPNKPRFEFETAISFFQPLSVRGALGFHLKGGYRYTSVGLLINEKFQIGGNKLLRGFDEASIFTSYYGLITAEYRLLLSNNSYFSFPFVDAGYVEDVDGNNSFVAGLGGGLGFENKVGLFNFSVAVGKDNQSSFDFGKPKAHFGFVSLF